MIPVDLSGMISLYPSFSLLVIFSEVRVERINNITSLFSNSTFIEILNKEKSSKNVVHEINK